MGKTDKIKMRNKMAKLVCMLFSSLWILLSIGLVASYAEVVLIKSPLSWYETGTGENALPKLVNAEYDLSGFVATQGQIKTICVNYEAAGKVEVEVSADNGLHYYAIINGVPLKSGFVSGDRLRWKAQIFSDDAKLYSVKIAYTDTAGVIGTFGQPDLSGFKYRKSVFIKNSGEEALYNYQIKLKLGENESVKGADLNCSGKSQADFKDIRFTAADAQTPLAYYRENIEGAEGVRTAVFWVKVPQIPKEGVTLYLYYGNADAEDLSDANKTFDFFEDFKSSTLDNNKWVVHIEPKGSAVISLGKMKLDAAEIISKDFKFKEGIIEYSCFVESGHENSLNIRNKTDDSYDTPIWLAYSSAYKGAEHCIAVDGVVKSNDALTKPQVSGATYNYRLDVLDGKIIFERFDVASNELLASANYQLDPKVKSGYLSLRSGGDGSGRNIMDFGTLRVRKSAAALPIIEGLGKEETVSLPIFVGTTLSPAAGVVLKDDAKSGYYLSQDISSSEPVRIITPDWSLDSGNTNFDIKISADKGNTYKSGSEKEKFYYASKKDSAVGTNLKVRVDLSRDSIAQAGSGLSLISLDYRPGMINIISPNGGETWPQGAERDITWSASDYESSYPMSIEYSSDAGKNYALIAGSISNSGEYLWTVAGDDNQKVLIKVADANEPSVFDTSDKTFSILSATESSVSDYLGTGEGKWNDAVAWAGRKVPGLTSEVKIAANATIYADEPISFRSLNIGDGIGKITTTVVLKAGVNKGCGEIIIRKGGRLIQDGQEPVVITGNLSIKSGGILTYLPNGKIDVTAKNINLEPGSSVTADGLDENSGGLIKMVSKNYFYINSVITADGKDGTGADGGKIKLFAHKFGGKNADIHAHGASGKKRGGNGGEIYVVSHGGGLHGQMEVNAGNGPVMGKEGNLVINGRGD